MKRNKRLSLLLIPFLLSCQNYTGPFFYVDSDSEPSYILLDSVSAFQTKVDQLSNLIFVLGTTTCGHCEDLDIELQDFVVNQNYSIYHLYFNTSVTNETDYSILTNVINGKMTYIPETYGASFYVPVIFIIQEKIATYEINSDFVSTLHNCIEAN